MQLRYSFLSFRRSHDRSMGGRVQQWAPGQVGVVPYRSVEWFNPNSLPRPVSRFGKIRGKSSRAQRACDIYKSISGPSYISATAMRLGSGSLRCTAMKIIQRENVRAMASLIVLFQEHRESMQMHANSTHCFEQTNPWPTELQRQNSVRSHKRQCWLYEYMTSHTNQAKIHRQRRTISKK